MFLKHFGNHLQVQNTIVIRMFLKVFEMIIYNIIPNTLLQYTMQYYCNSNV